MSIFDSEAGIITNEEVLLEVYIPGKLKHREGQTEFLASCMKPAAMGRRPRSAFLYGGTGVGKTSLVNWMFREFGEYTSKTKTAYVNCWKNPTMHGVLIEIVSQLGGFTNRREPVKELSSILENKLKNDLKLIICLDEIDHLQDTGILYDFSRAGYGIIAISNDAEALVDIDQRIKSSLGLERIEFQDYNKDEMVDILKERAEYGLKPGSINQSNLEVIAQKSEGDARVAIETLRRAALYAEEEGKEKIELEHILKSVSTGKFAKKSKLIDGLKPHEKIIYNIIKENKKISSSDLFEKYKKSAANPKGERMYRLYVEQLANSGLVQSLGDVRWRGYVIVE